ncbi:hypothetical protein [Paenibacillus macquariensis]|uniref:Uncharacterized protein n=1 Tax=Paenibacillus macquariensis TaxID=948756 RepID=A0ABY1KHK5_9BACL|nr:hypothetical protein [Paenibacillus macquariensis]MEC0093164.1 hypothetical protein [Paenibacillus macquariensis]SIR73495.1 hypothetical protein SAMN05421578_1528 [Paenibacillus macquariensis]
MVGHQVERTKGTKDYIRYYQCGNFRQKGSAVCNSNMIHADYAEACHGTLHNSIDVKQFCPLA